MLPEHEVSRHVECRAQPPRSAGRRQPWSIQLLEVVIEQRRHGSRHFSAMIVFIVLNSIVYCL